MIRKTYSVILLLSLLLSVFAYGITEEISIPLEHPVDELGIALDDIGPAVSDESGIVLNDDPIEITSEISLGMSDQSEANATKGIPATLTLGVKEKATLKVSGKVKYRSSKAAVATVSSKGVITAKKKGKAVITVTSGKKELGRCTVQVVAAPKRVTVSPKTASIEIGQTLQLEAKLPKNTHASLTYSSSNRKVVKVSALGLVTTVSAGKATVTVTTHNGKTAKCTVTVTEPPEPSVTLVYAEVNPIEGTVTGETAKAFKEKLESLTNGSVTVELQGSGVMGSESDVLRSILSGINNVDIVRCSAYALNQYGCDKSVLLNLPYTFESDAHFWMFANSNLAREILDEPQSVGLPFRGICYGQDGFRHFFFNDVVKGIDDLEGLKIRVSSDPIMTGMVNDLGAAATVVSFSELYSALQSGVIDGAEQPTLNYLSNSFYEVAPCLLLDGHTVGAFQILITDSAWEKLSKKQQKAVMTAGKYAAKVCKSKQAAMEKEALAQLKEKGVTVVKVSDRSAWRKACKDTIEANTTDKALYNKIIALANS